MNVGIFIYDQAEVLDFSGPFEVFATASRISGLPPPFSVSLIGETGETVSSRAGYSVNPRYKISDHPSLGVLIVPGGAHEAELEKPQVIRWIAEQAQSARIVASVDTAANAQAPPAIRTVVNETGSISPSPKASRQSSAFAAKASSASVANASVPVMWYPSNEAVFDLASSKPFA